VGPILLNIRKHRKYSWAVGICWTGIFEKRNPRKYSWPVGVCGRDTFKNKSAQKLFLASGNMLDRYF
jgi:hypothetical protein